MDIDEEEDELIEECDIIYTGEYSNEINLFQFPLIPKENLKLKIVIIYQLIKNIFQLN